MPDSRRYALSSVVKMRGRNSGEVSESARSIAVTRSGAALATGIETREGGPSIDEAGQQDACYAGACEHHQKRDGEQHLDLLPGARESARTDHDEGRRPMR